MSDKPHGIRKRMKAARQRAGLTEETMGDLRYRSKGVIYYNETAPGKPSDELVADYAQYTGESERYLRTGRRQ
jgi:hypothetical protein